MTTPAMLSFMNAVLGEDATTALVKAGERSESLANVIGPRVIVGWVNLASRWDYSGVVPGHEASFLQFQKSEHGLTGAVALGDQQLDFENAQADHLAAMLCVGLGCPPDLKKSEGASAPALEALGRSIDLMVKMRVVDLLKAETPRCKGCNKFYSAKLDSCPHCDGAPACSKCDGKKVQQNVAQGEDRWRCPKCDGSAMDKAEKPGKAAGALAPLAPVAQTAPVTKQPTRSAKPPKQIAMTKSMSERKCSVCEAPQFRKGELTGCYCLRDLARFTKSEPKGDGYLVTFGPEWGKSHIRLFLDIVGEE